MSPTALSLWDALRIAAVLTSTTATWLWVIGCTGCSREETGEAKPQTKGSGTITFPVDVAPVKTQPADYRIEAVGTIEAFEEVQVTSRVGGVVERVAFAEGDSVQEGNRLVFIEPKRYRLAVEAARATLARAQAEKASAELALKRRVDANAKSPGLVRNEDIDQARARFDIASAAEAEARSAASLAELNLRDAYVQAPVSGTIDTRIVSTGQYVQPGTKLATIVRREPLLFRFRVSEAEAERLSVGVPLTFAVRGQSGTFDARITHVAETADSTSRMVAITSEVTDKRRDVLRPGSFAQATVEVGGEREVLVISETAVRPTERGFLVFVVEGERARAQVVELGLRTANGMIEVRTGLHVDDMIVVRGGEALREGAKVRITEPGTGVRKDGAS
ncbi:MAG: efflux RND transporter periplasmic adaptor subunit [Deltaproteobacteria bacterium]|nr:efflux RND transporter periplasmic adaptor subunit [Deltaproteobacteria bacterium]